VKGDLVAKHKVWTVKGEGGLLQFVPT
jgi:hypothetical protein